MSESKLRRVFTCDGCGATTTEEHKTSVSHPKGWGRFYCSYVISADWCPECVELLIEAGWAEKRKESPYPRLEEQTTATTPATRTPLSIPVPPHLARVIESRGGDLSLGDDDE